MRLFQPHHPACMYRSLLVPPPLPPAQHLAWPYKLLPASLALSTARACQNNNNNNNNNNNTRRFDPVTGEKFFILFGLITKKGPDNEVQLAKLIQNINAAGVHNHTYDAKSGTGLRITRLGVTETRLLKFAEAIEFSRKFRRDRIKEACLAIGLEITNPDNPEGRTWFVYTSKQAR